MRCIHLCHTNFRELLTQFIISYRSPQTNKVDGTQFLEIFRLYAKIVMSKCVGEWSIVDFTPSKQFFIYMYISSWWKQDIFRWYDGGDNDDICFVLDYHAL